MGRDYVTLGSTPHGEDCAQVGVDDYRARTPQEARVYIDQLTRVFGQLPEKVRLRLKSFPHDFGTYHEVICDYDDEDPEATDYAIKLENESPEFWDEIAISQLQSLGIPVNTQLRREPVDEDSIL